MFTCRHLVALQSVDDEISSVYISFFLRWLSCKTPNTRCYDNGDYKRKQMLSTLTFLYYAEHCIHCVVLIRRTGIETKVTSVRVFIFFFFTLRWLRSHCCTFGFPPHIRLFLIAVKRKMSCSPSLYSEIHKYIELKSNWWQTYEYFTKMVIVTKQLHKQKQSFLIRTRPTPTILCKVSSCVWFLRSWMASQFTLVTCIVSFQSTPPFSQGMHSFCSGHV